MPTIGLPVEWGGFGFDYRGLEEKLETRGRDDRLLLRFVVLEVADSSYATVC